VLFENAGRQHHAALERRKKATPFARLSIISIGKTLFSD